MPKAKAQFEISAVDKTKGAFSSVSKGVSSLGNRIAGLGLALGAVGFGAFIKNTIDAADNIAKLAQGTGLSIEDLSSLEHAATLSGASLESLSKAAKGVSIAALEAGNGLLTYTRIFDDLNVQYKNADGTLRGTKEIILDVADSMKGMTDITKRNALAVRLFGRAGQELIPLLVQGSEGIRAMQQEARDLGLELSTETAQAAEQFNDDLVRLKGAAAGAGIALTKDLLPSLTNISTAMAEAAKEGGLLQGLLVGFGGIVHELAGGDIGQLNGEIADLENQLEGLGRAAQVTYISESIDEWLGFGKPGDVEARTQVLIERLTALRKQRELLLNPPSKETTGITAPAGGAGGAGSDPAADKLVKQYDSVIERLEREQALLGDNSQLAQVRYDLESGKLKELAPQHKANILALAETLNAERASIEADKEAAEVLKETIKAQEDYNQSLDDQAKALQDQYDPLGALNDELTHLNGLLDTGRISWDIWASASEDAADKAEAALDRLEGKAEESADEIGEFALEAARSIQSTISDNLYDVMQGNFDNIGNSFKSLIDKMIADLLAAQISKYFFGDFDVTGKVGGQFGGFLESLFPGFANGTNFAPGGLALVGERGPELVNLPRGSKVTPTERMGGTTVVNNFTISGQVDRRTQQQIADAAFQGASRATRRNS